MFFPPLSFIFLCSSFFLLWHGSLWCDQIECSVQDSQWKNCTDGNWWSDIILCVMWSSFMATELIFAMLAAVLSQRVVL